MSTNNVKAFFDKLEGDEGLQTKVCALNELGKKNADEAVAALVAIGADAGLDFTADDYAKVKAEVGAKAEAAGEDALPDVSGQCSLPDNCPTSWACTKTDNI